jgi:Glycosyltransferases involved in cell wall biogenesis
MDYQLINNKIEENIKTNSIEYENILLLKGCEKKGLISKKTFYQLLKKKYIKDLEIDIKDNHTEENFKKECLISIIIPTYNRADFLLECIESILNQRYSNIEIIIIDDCSTDKTKEIIEEKYNGNIKIKYYKNDTNKGPGYNRKFGYLKSKGEYIIFCDDDDYYIDELFFLKAIKKFQEYNNELAFVSSSAFTNYEKENKLTLDDLDCLEKINNNEYLENFQIKHEKPKSTFTTVFNKIILEKAKLSDMKMVNDSSIYMRALTACKFSYIMSDIIGIYRIHSTNITFTLSAEFLIENLEEKKNIYDLIIKKELFKEVDLWLFLQAKLTIFYFISGVKPKFNELIKLLKWTKHNLKKYKYRMIILSLLKFLKVKIKFF